MGSTVLSRKVGDRSNYPTIFRPENLMRFDFSEKLRLYGDSIIGNLDRNLRAFQTIGLLHNLPDIKSLVRFLQVLNPPGELLSKLQWKFTFYTAMRVDGFNRAIRCYFNLFVGLVRASISAQ